MAIGMDALLRIKAVVQGSGAVDALTTGIGNLNRTASGASSGFKRLAGSLGGVVGGFQLLTPLATGAGLVGIATNSIKAAERMHDLSQSTGLSVEALSRFRRPAALAGIDIETVAKSLQKLSKGLVGGKGAATDALKELGIKTQDAAGRMKSADQILLEVADRFKAMPDGIAKTGLAMQLFGKSGAEMIPMLNMGGAELAKFKGITTDYANQADKAGDAMVMLQGKVGMLGGQIAQVLLPFIIQATEALTVLVGGFTSLPGPVQVLIGGIAALVIAWGPLVGILTTTIQLFTVISGLQLGATVAGWAGAIVPAVAAMTAALSGFLAFLTGTALPALIGFFSGPVGWTVLAVAAVVTMAIAFRKPIMEFLGWLGTALVQGFTAAWETTKAPVAATWQWMGDRFNEFAELFRSRIVEPITSAWEAVTTAIPNAMRAAAQAVASVWNGVMNGIRSVVNAVLSSIAGRINGAAAAVNRLIAGYNALPVPDLPFIPTIGIPQYAKGGFVTRPTLAMIGEGGEPEYVVPQSKAPGFAARVMDGRTGAAAIPGMSGGYKPYGLNEALQRRIAQAQQAGQFRNLSIEGERVQRNQIARSMGFVPGAGSMPITLRPGVSPSTSLSMGTGTVQLSITTGPVLEFDGTQYVRRADFERGMKATADGVVAKLRSPAARIATGGTRR